MRLTDGYFKGTKYQVGVGGPFCPCCTQLPPNEMKIKVRRLRRRKAKQDTNRTVVDILREHNGVFEY